jgi:hypothetical protein
VYGVIQHTPEQASAVLNRKFDIIFQRIVEKPEILVGYFFGTRVSISENFDMMTKLWFCIDEADFPVIVTIQSEHGNSKHKQGVHHYLKQQLGRLDHITLLKEEINESVD